MKLCKTCREIKKRNEFYKHKITKDGLWPECKECNIARSTRWNKNHPEEKRRNSRRNWAKHREARIRSGKICYDNREYNGLRAVVLKRDGGKCVKCGMTRKEHLLKWGKDINIDHINRDRKDNNLDNLQAICLVCHGSKSGRDAKGCPKRF